MGVNNLPCKTNKALHDYYKYLNSITAGIRTQPKSSTPLAFGQQRYQSLRVTLIAESSSNFAANRLKSAELALMQHSNYCRECYNASDGQKLKRNYFVTIAGTNPNPEP